MKKKKKVVKSIYFCVEWSWLQELQIISETQRGPFTIAGCMSYIENFISKLVGVTNISSLAGATFGQGRFKSRSFLRDLEVYVGSASVFRPDLKRFIPRKQR